MKKTISESGIPVNFKQIVNNNGGLDIDLTEVNKVFHMGFMAIADTLALIKSVDVKKAVAIKDLKGNLLLAGVISYVPNENDTMPGNWNFIFTRDKEDLVDVDVIEISDNRFQSIFATTCFNLYSIQFGTPIYVQAFLEAMANTLFHWLDINASETEEVEIEEPGYFLASVVVEKGEKIISIVPDGAIKRLIKDDAALEA